VRPAVLDGLEQSLDFMDIQECGILKGVPGRGVVVELPAEKEGQADRTMHDPCKAVVPSTGAARDLAC
jgi:hypothetical protein